MSQVVKITKVSIKGATSYLGDLNADSSQPIFSKSPNQVMEWLCSAWRKRFNDHRSQRKKYGKDKVLIPLGDTIVDLTDKQAREEHSFLQAVPSLVLQSPEQIEAKEWFSAAKRRKTLKESGHAEDHESYTVSYRVSGSSLEDVTRALLHRSALFAIEVDNRADGSGIKDEVMEVFVGSLSIGVYVTTSDTGFDITGISLGSEFSSSDVKMLAIMYANPGDDASHAVLIMSPTAEVEDAAQQVKHAENARLKAVRRAADEGVSQRVLAKMTGVSQATIGRWLKDG